MYGTVARFRLKPGQEQKLAQIMESYKNLDIPGFRSEWVYKLDANSNEHFLVVAFDDKETYVANAKSPEQDRRYREFRQLLESDPEWHDGEIIHAFSPEGLSPTDQPSWQSWQTPPTSP